MLLQLSREYSSSHVLDMDYDAVSQEVSFACAKQYITCVAQVLLLSECGELRLLKLALLEYLCSFMFVCDM